MKFPIAFSSQINATLVDLSARQSLCNHIAYATLMAVAAVLLVGCGATGPQFKTLEPPAGEASVLYVYRPNRFASGALSPLLALDGQTIGRLSNGSFARREIPAGPHKVQLLRPSSAWGNFKEPSIEVVTVAGRVSIVRYDIAPAKSGKSVPAATMVSGVLVPIDIPVMDHTLTSVEAGEAIKEIGETRDIE